MMPDKRLLSLVPESMRYILGKVLLSWLSLLAGILLWFCLGGQLQAALENRSLSLGAFLLLGLCLLLRFVLPRLLSWVTHQATACVKGRMRTLIYQKLRSLEAPARQSFSTAELVQLGGEGVEQLESYFGNYLPQFFFAVLAPLTLLLVFLPLSPATGIALFLCVPLIPVVIAVIQTYAKRMLGSYWAAYADLSDSFLENLQGLTTLKVYSADEERHRQMNEEAEHFRIVTMKVLTMQLNSLTIMDFVAWGGTALGCILTGRALASGRISFGEAFAMVMLSSEFFLSMRALGSYFHTAMNGVAAAERMFKLLDLPEAPARTGIPREGDIVIRSLRFSYGTREGEEEDQKQVWALDGLNLTIPRGSLFSFVGESGSGKSTLGGLLSGRLSGYEGSITLGGTEISQADPAALRSLITVVTSDSYLFAGSVADTLRMGKKDATDEEMRLVLEKVALWDFVEEQGGLSFQLKERGSNLSGGQRQRLALARALLKDSPIYLFDEATSNIDLESEEVILKAILSLRGSHTLLLISHRLENVVPSDGILFLEKGRGREEGTHAALMAAGQGYARLFQAQKALESLGKEEES